METAKVDIRKLQLLNDRINQTIEALNQVRLTVHGVGPAFTQTPFNGHIGMGLGHTNGNLWNQIPGAGIGGHTGLWNQMGGAFGPMNPIQNYPGMGLGHTTGNVWTQMPNAFVQGQNTGVWNHWNQPGVNGHVNPMNPAYALQGMNQGLNHTTSNPWNQVNGFGGQMNGMWNQLAGLPAGYNQTNSFQNMNQGLGHTTGNLWNAMPIVQNQSPWNNQAWMQMAGQGNPFGLPVHGAMGQGGLGHTTGDFGGEQFARNPYEMMLAQARIHQTFPFAQWGVSPFTTMGY